MPERLTHNFVESAFAAEGYTLLSRYENCYQRLNFICKNGHSHSISYTNFKTGKRCAYCQGSIVTHDFVKQFFLEQGYTILSEYKNSTQKLDFICPSGHKHSISYGNFRAGRRCIYCQRLIVTKQQVKDFFESHGYKLLSNYINAKQKLTYLCPLGHKHSIVWDHFRRGQRCPTCSGRIIKHQDVSNSFAKEGYKLLSVYRNSHSKLKFLCPNGHSHSIAWAQWQYGQRCRNCSKSGYKISKPGRLYYLKIFIKNKEYWKIGITNNTIKKRYQSDKLDYVVLMDLFYQDGAVPYMKELSILEEHKEYRYKGLPILKSGNTELFVKDVLEIDDKVDQFSF